jgi:hypothetical protein
MSNKNWIAGGGLVLVVAALGFGQFILDDRAEAATTVAGTVTAPMFEVDPLWPKPLPNHWVLGMNIGVGVDSRDHIYIVHRQNTLNPRNEFGLDENGQPTAECCLPAPPVLEFDPQGNLVGSFGGPGDGYVWPASNHGIGVDDRDNLWIGGNGAGDSHILKFTRDGRFLAQYGVPGMDSIPNSLSTEHFGRVAKISFDVPAQEAYVADGYRNHRVAVLDMETGAIKRFWGAYGNTPSDENFGPYNPDAPLIQQFRTPVHCAEPTRDGLVYVCDRPNNRIQVFQKDGTFVKEVQIAPRTRGDGSIWDIAFSGDPEQKYLYLADGKNAKIYILDRLSLQVLTEFGDGGRQPGQFLGVHSIATDSQGNIYTTETYEGRRLQKFVYKGIGQVARDQGVVWPVSTTPR